MTGDFSSTDYENSVLIDETMKDDEEFLERIGDDLFEIQYEDLDRDSRPVKKETYSIKELHRIYDECGPTSPQFYEQVKKLLIYLQHRYMNRYDLDCLHDCYVRLLESFAYWDPERCNIVSWVHMVVRNRISSFCHTVKKKQRESNLLDETVADPKTPEGMHDRDKISVFLQSFRRISIIKNRGLSEVIAMLQDHPIHQGSLWKDGLCRKKAMPRKSVISMQWS